ncbi:GntR family transcriptional regulator [Mameliella sediminis]|uniref:GntR family transcriptional regulator n=1 Tax=Mameliella sediminis TaxID=2836866 RepID=UPI001C467ECF|nr:GntR family transcriptional regulator [Mameliella sediminis]MBV7392917.1 GntR family transcriptional regulator [Mameliella sediminis]MBY6161533.1 GntR family transcriptional regulator [Mameliella alba]MBY6170001.1 GntR family transcriptional regulator [Mameliella alba]MBY6175022.1 GntR family transcriptional regulator [Mameliella alba]
MPLSSSVRTAELQADKAHQELIRHLREGRLRSGAFMSMPMLVDQLAMPIAAVREAVKRAEAAGLVTILPKRGLAIMEADPERTRECLELRAIFDAEGARRLIDASQPLPLGALRDSHEAMCERARAGVTPEVQRRAIETDLSLHDMLARGIGLQLAEGLYEDNRNRVAIIQNMRPFLADRIIPAMQEHLEIISALETRDADRAVTAIRLHLVNTLRWWGIGFDTA